MIKKILYIAICIGTMISCTQSDMEFNEANENIYIAKVECEASQVHTRAYDADLNWSWQMGDDLCGYQVAGRNIRNSLNFIEANSSFVCEAFQYMFTEPAQFHFIYPAAAEVSEGVLVAVQDGTWRPLSVTTTEETLLESMPAYRSPCSARHLNFAFSMKIKLLP